MDSLTQTAIHEVQQYIREHQEEERSEYTSEIPFTHGNTEGYVEFKVYQDVTVPSFDGNYDTPPHGWEAYWRIGELRIVTTDEETFEPAEVIGKDLFNL